MQAYFYTFSKRTNSTKLPSGNGASYDILIKNESDFTAPTLEVIGDSFRGYNYVHIPFMNRFYFITECRSIASNTYELSLECDVMGTYGSEIVGQSVFMLMSSSFYDTELDDTRIVPTDDIIFDSKYGDFDIISGVTPTAFPVYQFLSVVNNSGKLNGIDVFFGLNLISDYLRKVTDRNWAQQFAADVQGINPFDAVNGAWWSPLIPQKCHSVGSNSASIYDVTISAQCLTTPDVLKHTATIDVPKPSVTDFRYSDKYVKYYLEIPYIGVIDVPTELARHATKLEYTYAGDCLTGQIVVAPKIRSVCLGIFSTSLKSDIQMARQGSKTNQALTSTVLGAAGSALAGAKLAGASGALIGGVAGAAVGSIQGVSAMPHIERTTSSSGSIALVGCRDTIGTARLIMAESAANLSPASFGAVAGRPSQKVAAITSGCGYVQTVNANVSITGLKSEQERINSILNGGAYFE